MNAITALLVLVYITIIVSFIWARFRYFTFQSSRSRISSLLYDPVIGIHVSATLYFLIATPSTCSPINAISLVLYILCLALFWWSVVTTEHLEFAFSDHVGKVVTTGPFAYVRHPFYLSYTLVWFGSSILFDSIFLWITLIYLTTFYLTSAKTEEEVYLKSEYSREYRDYSQKVGMFLPRITLWKN